MAGKINCPNCGAPVIKEKCPYCGTIIYDFANIAINKVSYLRMNFFGSLCVCRAVARNVEIDMSPNDAVFYNDDKVLMKMRQPSYSMRVEFDLEPDENGALLLRYMERDEL